MHELDESLKNTPVIAGLNSSVLVEKIVLPIAKARVFAFTVKE